MANKSSKQQLRRNYIIIIYLVSKFASTRNLAAVLSNVSLLSFVNAITSEAPCSFIKRDNKREAEDRTGTFGWLKKNEKKNEI